MLLSHAKVLVSHPVRSNSSKPCSEFFDETCGLFGLFCGLSGLSGLTGVTSEPRGLLILFCHAKLLVSQQGKLKTACPPLYEEAVSKKL